MRLHWLGGLGLLLLVTTISTATCSSNSDRSFDYYYLVRQWPATFCNDHSCTHKPPRRFTFTVHGLWPQREDGSWPEFCDPNDHLQVRQIWDLIPFLSYYWPSWSSDNKAFWEHEWSRHGTCSGLRSQHNFFKTVLKLHRSLDVQAALQAASIEPSATRHYPVADVEDAIIKRHGVKPHVTCDYSGNLAEIMMCISTDLKPMDCTDEPHPHASRMRRKSGRRSVLGSWRAKPASSAGGKSNNYCKYVRIPPLKR